MGFIDENLVNAGFLKGDELILFAGVGHRLQLGLQPFFLPLQILDGEVIVPVPALRKAVKSFFQPLNFPFNFLLQEILGHGNFLKLALGDDNGVIVPGGDFAQKTPPVLGLKVLFRGH